jgi:hypothetical protein
MLPLITLIAGFAIGWSRAARRGGNTKDKWQYAIGHGIFGFIIGFVLAIVAVRLGGG